MKPLQPRHPRIDLAQAFQAAKLRPRNDICLGSPAAPSSVPPHWLEPVTVSLSILRPEDEGAGPAPPGLPAATGAPPRSHRSPSGVPPSVAPTAPDWAGLAAQAAAAPC